MRSIRNFARTISKTNIELFHVINISMNLWNRLSNDVKVIFFIQSIY